MTSAKKPNRRIRCIRTQAGELLAVKVGAVIRRQWSQSNYFWQSICRRSANLLPYCGYRTFFRARGCQPVPLPRPSQGGGWGVSTACSSPLRAIYSSWLSLYTPRPRPRANAPAAAVRLAQIACSTLEVSTTRRSLLARSRAPFGSNPIRICLRAGRLAT